MAEKKGFFGEFKEFISRGNVVDMAIGIIIGGLFTAIVSSFVKDILNPEYSYTCVNQLVWKFKANNDEKTVEIWLDDIELIGGNRLSIWKRW